MKLPKNKSNQKLYFIVSYAIILFMLILDYITYLQNRDSEISIIIACVLLFLLLIMVCLNYYFIKIGWGIVNGKIYFSNLSIKELCFTLFGRKRCPNCLNKLEKRKSNIFVAEGARRVGNSTLEGEIFKEKTKYFCEVCKKEYTVQQLINSEKP